METLKNATTDHPKGQNFLKKTYPVLIAMMTLFLLNGCGAITVAQRFDLEVGVELPSWAPYYDNAELVHYYYLPDIECYYDVRSREFIYMEDGEWMFSRSLPPVYAWFDLENCFVVALDARVMEPWRHFHYYVAHYPRFYYRTLYRDSYGDRNRPLRGFNENARNIVFNRPGNRENNSNNFRNSARPEVNTRTEGRQNNQFRQNNEVRQNTEVRQNNEVRQNSEVRQNNEVRQNSEVKRIFPERKVEQTHPSQAVNYYGRDIGRPVRVLRNMKKAEDIKIKETKPVKQEKDSRQR